MYLILSKTRKVHARSCSSTSGTSSSGFDALILGMRLHRHDRHPVFIPLVVRSGADRDAGPVGGGDRRPAGLRPTQALCFTTARGGTWPSPCPRRQQTHHHGRMAGAEGVRGRAAVATCPTLCRYIK